MTETETALQEQIEVLQMKYLALKERLQDVISNYEDQDINRRVAITLLTKERDSLQQKVEEFETSQREAQESAKPVSD